jgi:small subunit ribosomal protein S4
MGRFIGPKLKLAKKFNDGVFCRKFNVKKTVSNTKSNLKKKTEYAMLLASKEKILYLYNIRDRQLANYVHFATSKEGNSENVLATLLESRIDNVVYRLGMGKTRNSCRQLVSHGYVTVNGKPVNVAAYQVKKNDVISLNEKKSKNIFCQGDDNLNLYKWLTWDEEKKRGTVLAAPEIEDIPERIEIKDVI